jgi:branched-chain amino acid transport system permease protein
MEFSALGQLLAQGIIQGSIYALGAIGFMIVYSISRVVNFCQGEYFMLGGMVVTTSLQAGFPLWFSLSLGLIIPIFAGAITYAVIHPVRNASIVTTILITFGIAFVIRGIALLLWGTDVRRYAPFFGGEPIAFLNIFIPRQGLLILGVTMLTLFSLYFFFQRTLSGKAMRACAINRLGAQIVGIKPVYKSLLSFIIAGSLGGIEGIFMTPVTMTSYDIGLTIGIKAFIAALIGGLTNPVGVMLGGFFIGIVEALSSGLVSSLYKTAIVVAVFLIVLSFRRTGVLGEAETGRV